MRITVLIIGLLLATWMFFEAFALSFLSTNNALAKNDQASADLAGWGILIAFLAALAAALAIAFPQLSTGLFAVAALTSIAIAVGGYSNHGLYAVVLITLAVMSFFGWRGKRADRRAQDAERQRQIERDQRLEALLTDRGS